MERIFSKYQIYKKVKKIISSFSGEFFEDRLKTKKQGIVYWISQVNSALTEEDKKEFLREANDAIKNMYGEEKCITL